jgi:hypothetical protein
MESRTLIVVAAILVVLVGAYFLTGMLDRAPQSMPESESPATQAPYATEPAEPAVGD